MTNEQVPICFVFVVLMLKLVLNHLKSKPPEANSQSVVTSTFIVTPGAGAVERPTSVDLDRAAHSESVAISEVGQSGAPTKLWFRTRRQEL